MVNDRRAYGRRFYGRNVEWRILWIQVKSWLKSSCWLADPTGGQNGGMGAGGGGGGGGGGRPDL